MSKFLRPLLFLAGAGSIIYGAYRAQRFIDSINSLSFTLTGVQLQKESSWFDYLANGFHFIIGLKIINEGKENIPFEGLDFNIYVDNAYVGNTKIESGRMIPARSTINLDLDYHIKASQISDNLANIIKKSLSGEPVQIKVTGTIQGQKVQMPVDETFILNEPTEKQIQSSNE